MAIIGRFGRPGADETTDGRSTAIDGQFDNSIERRNYQTPVRTEGMDESDWEATWQDHASAFDRVRAVVLAAPEPESAEWIADHARVAESTARGHLDRLADMGVVTTHAGESGTTYGPDPAYVRFREIRELAGEYDSDELSGFAVDLKESIAEIREAYDADTPGELRAAAAEPGVDADAAREMRRAASDWEHYAYRLSLLEDAITRYDEYTATETPA